MLKTLKRWVMPLNRWYDRQDDTYRFFLFMCGVGLPFIIGGALWATVPIIGLPLLIWGGSLGMIRVIAFL